MKWAGSVLLIACGVACTFPSYLVRADDDGASAGQAPNGGAPAAGAAAIGASVSAGTAPLAGNATGGAGQAGSASQAGSAGQAGGGGSPETLTPFGVAGAWQLTFQDEFEGDALDATRWITYMLDGENQFRVWGGRQEYIADENVKVRDGDCVLTAENVSNGGQPYTSGALNSAGLFEQEYGFFEARIRLPLGNGFWGVWALRSLAGWPPAINGVEVLGGQPARATFSYWYQSETDAERVWHEGTTDYTNGYHIYGIDWQPTHVAFYVDGALIKSLEDPDKRLTGALYPGVNLSISAGDTGDPVPDETTPWPGEVRIDWVRVYAKMP